MADLVKLDWDTEFFGISIGRARLLGEDVGSLDDVDSQARSLGIVCLYAAVDPNDLELNWEMQRQGYRLVEVAVDLEHPTSILTHHPPTPSRARWGTADDMPMVYEMIPLLARWSRFAADARFGRNAAERMHRAWVERALQTDDQRALVVTEDESGFTGFATQSELNTGLPRIDLIATSKPGSGAAQAAVDFSWASFGEGPSRGGPIAVRNTASLRFVEQMGLRVVSTEYVYHRWLDEGPRGGR